MQLTHMACSASVRLVLLVCFASSGLSAAQSSKSGGGLVELTRSDLFSLPDWATRDVTVDGFRLGMSTDQAFEAARSKNLKFVITLPNQATPCDNGWCDVCQSSGNCIGLRLLFRSGSVTAIKVAVPADAEPQVKESNIAKQFKGLTYIFFNRYSDTLRNRIMGYVEPKEVPDKVPGSAFVYMEYHYPHLGVVVHTTIDKRDRPQKPFDLEVDFVSPGT